MAEPELDRLMQKMTAALTALGDAKAKSIADSANAQTSNAVNDAYRSYETADNAIRDYVFRLVGHRH